MPSQKIDDQVLKIWHNVSLYALKSPSKNDGDIDPADNLQNNEKEPMGNFSWDSDKIDIELTMDVGLPQVPLLLGVQNEEVVGHVEANFESMILTFLNVDDQNNQGDTFFSDALDDETSNEDLKFRWMDEPIEQWSKQDTRMWYYETACDIQHSFGLMTNTLLMPGTDLLQLSESDFIGHDRHFGKKLFDSLREMKRSQDSVRNGTHVDYLRNLLINPWYCGRWVEWTDYEKKRFRIVKSEKVAKFWGSRRGINNMTWDSFRRGLSNHYEDGPLRKVDGKQLHYEFVPNVGGLESNDPNFVNDN